MVPLESSKLFSQLRPEELASVRGIARERALASNEEIFKEGDAGDGLYYVSEGLVEVSGLVGPNVRHIFSRIGPGDIFGEMAVIEDKPRSATAVARQPSRVLFFERAAMLRAVEGSPALALGLLREISARLREFNRQYLEEVLQTERLAVVGRFARSIVHDLKNPLNIIGITAELAGMEQVSLEIRQQCKGRIRKQVERISDMISEILDFTQGSQSAFVLALTDYKPFLEQIVEELRPEVTLKSAQLEIEGDVPSVQLSLNPKRLRRVFYNLVHNATDAMPQGGRITVRVRQEPKLLVTEIEDSGSGIAPEIAGQLFQAFVTHGKAHGTGLGLSICKKIVEDHDGWINSRSEPGRGAVFAFGLPLPNHPPS